MNKAQLIVAVGAGYLLGRTRKLRWALALAGVGASRKLPGNAKELTAQGVRMLRASPETMELAQTARGRLTEAGRAAAMAALSSRLDALSDRLHEQTDLLLTETGPEEDTAEPRDGQPRPEHADRPDSTEEQGSGKESARSAEPKLKKPVQKAPPTRAGGTRPSRRRRDTTEDTTGDTAGEVAGDVAEAVSDRPVKGRRTGDLAGHLAGTRTQR